MRRPLRNGVSLFRRDSQSRGYGSELFQRRRQRKATDGSSESGGRGEADESRFSRKNGHVPPPCRTPDVDETCFHPGPRHKTSVSVIDAQHAIGEVAPLTPSDPRTARCTAGHDRGETRRLGRRLRQRHGGHVWNRSDRFESWQCLRGRRASDRTACDIELRVPRVARALEKHRAPALPCVSIVGSQQGNWISIPASSAPPDETIPEMRDFPHRFVGGSMKPAYVPAQSRAPAWGPSPTASAIVPVPSTTSTIQDSGSPGFRNLSDAGAE